MENEDANLQSNPAHEDMQISYIQETMQSEVTDMQDIKM